MIERDDELKTDPTGLRPSIPPTLSIDEKIDRILSTVEATAARLEDMNGRVTLLEHESAHVMRELSEVLGKLSPIDSRSSEIFEQNAHVISRLRELANDLMKWHKTVTDLDAWKESHVRHCAVAKALDDHLAEHEAQAL